MVIPHFVNNFDDLVKLISTLKESDGIFVFFTGSKDGNGKSWCPDCVKAEPFIETAMTQDVPEDGHFISVSVDRDMWKNPQCVYRTDKRLRLSSIPALVRWPNSDQKLQMEQCANPDLLKMFFED